MKLQDYQTPLTDAEWPSLRNMPDGTAVACTLGLVRDLERNLRKCRTALEGLMLGLEITGHKRGAERCRRTLEETK